MKPGASIAYTFWHWRRSDVTRDEYEHRHRAFLSALTSGRIAGLRAAQSSRVAHAPWANGGLDAYQDRYVVDDWATFERLEAGAISGARHAAHASIAASLAGGIAGVYGVRLGAPNPAPRLSYWFAKPNGMSYADLDAALAPIIEGAAVLWIRRMVLGPTPEFCIEAPSALDIPSAFTALAIPLEPIWP